MAGRRFSAIAVVALAMAIGLLGGQARPAAAADGWTLTGATTYELDPSHGLVRVTVTLQVTNSTPDTSEPYTCIQYSYDPRFGYTPYDSTCYRTSSYYLDSMRVFVENEASSIKASSGGSALKLQSGSRGTAYRAITISFPRLYYGRSRTISVTYVINGGGPRSNASTRVMRAYASFCVTPQGIDSGSVTVRVPAGFSFATAGGAMSSKVSGQTRIYSSGTVADTASFWACFDGTDEAGYRTEQLTTASGRTVTLRSWPEDSTWATAVRADVSTGLPALAALIGKPMPGTAPLVIQEAVTGNEYAGFYDQDTNTITVSEDFQQPSLVDHELAHLWFNGTSFEDRWLDEGSAEWAARQTSHDQASCGRPVTTGSAIKLGTWVILTPRSTDIDREAVATEYDAACYVVTQVAAAAGTDRMTTALTALLDGRDPYSTDPAARRASNVATWKDWLDAVDELAVTPAGASPALASDLLVEYGVTDNRDLLAQRTAARSAYHDLEAEVGDWVVPVAVRAPLAAWDFGLAGTAIKAAEATWNLTGQSDAALPGIDARHGPAANPWAAARTTADLEAAATTAQLQLDAANDVAEVVTLVGTPLDFVQQVGLIGTAIPDPSPAVAAVRAGNAEQAGQIAASIRNAITGLRDAGQLRLEVASAILGLLLVLLVVAVAMRIRARRRRTALVAALATASASNLEAQPPLTGRQASDPSDTEMFQATQVGVTFGAVEDQAQPVVVPLMTPPDDPNG